MVLTFLKVARLGNTLNLVLLLDGASLWRGSWSTRTSLSLWIRMERMAKSPSEKISFHSECTFKLRRVLDCS